MRQVSIRKLKKYSNDVNVTETQKKYLKKYIQKLKKVRMIQIFILVLLIALWQIMTVIGVMDPFVFSSPSRICLSFISLASDGSIFYHIGITLAETFISFAFVTIFGILIAILLWWNDTVSLVLEPYLVVLNSLPKTALAPVFIVWLGNNMKTIIVAAVSVAVFGTVITLFTEFSSIEEDKVKLIQTLGGTKKDVLLKVVIPNNIPAIISNMKVNIGLSLVGVIIGEFLAANAGLGYLIIYGSQVFKLDWVMMSIVILCFMATLLYKILNKVEKSFHY